MTAGLAVVREFFDAINSGDVDEAIGLLSPEVRWSRPPDVPITGTLEGVEAVRKMWRAFAGSVDRFEMEPTRFESDGERVLAEVTFRGTPADGGRPFGFSGAQVFTVRDGRIGEVLEFRSVAEGEAALAR